MGNARKLPSGSYRAQVFSHFEYMNGKKVRRYESFTAPTAAEAEYMASSFKRDKDNIWKVKSITIREALDKYVDSKKNILSPSTLRTYHSYINEYYKSIENILLKDLTNSQIQNEFNSLSLNRSPKTVSNIYGLLSAALSVYYPNFILKVSLPTRRKIRTEIPTTDEIKKILDCVKGTTAYLPIVLAFSMGLRRGEIAALKWKDVDLNKRTIYIHTAIVLNDKKEWVEKTPKSYEGNRILDMPDIAYEEFKSLYSGNSPDERIYPYLPSAISNKFIRVTKELGLHHFRFHDLRHYFASVMLSMNVPDKYAMKRMGHATNTVLKNIYQHLIDDKDKEVTCDINHYISRTFEE